MSVSYAASGEIGTATLARLLAELFLGQATGTLHVDHGSGLSRAHFRDGFPVGVNLFTRFKPLGQYLLEIGWIDMDALDRSLAEVARTHKPQGRILVELGYLTENKLGIALRRQQVANLAVLLETETGSYGFEETDELPAWTQDVAVGPHDAVARFLATEAGAAAVEQILWEVGDGPLLLSPRWADESRRFELPDREIKALDMFRSPTTLAEAEASGALDPARLRILVAGAACFDLLTSQAPGERSERPPPPARTAPAPTPAAAATPAPAAVAAPPPAPAVSPAAVAAPTPEAVSEPAAPAAPSASAGAGSAPTSPADPWASQAPAEPAADPWASQAPAEPAADPWASQAPAEPAADPWASQAPAEPAADPWTSQAPAEPAADPWASQAPAEPAADPWASQAPAEPAADPWASQDPWATPAPAANAAGGSSGQAATEAAKPAAAAPPPRRPDPSPAKAPEPKPEPPAGAQPHKPARPRTQEEDAALRARRSRLLKRAIQNIPGAERFSSAGRPAAPAGAGTVSAPQTGASATKPPAGAASKPRAGGADKAASAPARPAPDAEARNLMREIDAVASRIEKQDLYTRLGLEKGEALPKVKAAYLLLAKRYHPDRVGALNLPEDAAKKVQRIFSAIQEAYETLGDAGRRAEYDKLLADDRVKGDRSRARKLAEAEVNFRKGEALFKKKDYAGALKYLEPACHVDPDNGLWAATLAWSRFNVGPREQVLKQVAASLARVTKMKQGADLAHYYLGLLARMKDDYARAVRHFEQAVEINGRLDEALTELRFARRRLEKSGEKGTRKLINKMLGKD